MQFTLISIRIPNEPNMEAAVRPTLALAIGKTLEALIMCAHRSGHGLLLEGGTGLGKTAMFQSLTKRVGIGYRRLDASVLEPSDLGGIPAPDALRQGRMIRAYPVG